MRRGTERRTLARGVFAAWLCAGSAGAADVAVLSQELGAANVAVRRDAAYTLNRMGVEAKAALPALIRALGDADKQVWSFSISAIANLGPDAKDAIPALIDGLGSSRARGRERDRRQSVTRAAFALSRIGAAAVPALSDALKSDDDGQRAGAAQALAGMGGAAAPAIPALIENLKGADEVRQESAEALGAIGVAAVKPLIDAVKSADARERAGAVMALGFAGTVAKEFAPTFLELLKAEGDPQVRVALLSAIPKFAIPPEEAAPLLAVAIKDDDEQVRHAAINALVPLRGARELALPALSAMLKDESATIRQRAARALGRMGPGAAQAVPALIEAGKLSPGDASIAGALSEIGPAALPALLAQLRDAPAPDAERLFGLLRGFGAPAVPVLKEAMKHPASEVRASAARTLGGMGSDAKGAVELLFAQATDADARARAAALRALVALEADSQRLKPTLESALKDSAPEVRRAAAAGLAGSGGGNGLGVAGLVDLLDDENAASRRSAVDELGKMGAPAAAALPALLERLTDPELQLPVISAIGKIGPAASATVPRLVELTAGGAVPQRVAVLAALAGIGKTASAALPLVHAAVKDDEGDVRVAAVSAVAAIESDESKVIAILVEALADQSGRVRRPAAAALSKFGERARVATPGLVSMLERDNERGVALLAMKVIGVRSVPDLLRALTMREPQVRVFACEQLASLGAEAKEAIPRLKELSEGQPKAVEEAARGALAKIESTP